MSHRHSSDNQYGPSIALCVTLVVTLLVGLTMFASTQSLHHSFTFAPKVLVQ